MKGLITYTILILVLTSCQQEPEEILGCTDNAASNYNSQATSDDGSCIYNPPAVFGISAAAINTGDYTHNNNVDVFIYDQDAGQYVFDEGTTTINPMGTTLCDMTLMNDGTTVTEGVSYTYQIKYGSTVLASGGFDIYEHELGFADNMTFTAYGSIIAYIENIGDNNCSSGATGFVIIIEV